MTQQKQDHWRRSNFVFVSILSMLKKFGQHEYRVRLAGTKHLTAVLGDYTVFKDATLWNCKCK